MLDFKRQHIKTGDMNKPDKIPSNDHLKREAEHLLSECSHTELCSAQSSSYIVLGDERASPRGRMKLIAQMLEKGDLPSKKLVHFIDNAFACMPASHECACGQNYKRLIYLARTHIHNSNARSLAKRLSTRALLDLLTSPKRLKAAAMAGRFTHPLVMLADKLGAQSLTDMLATIPRSTTGSHRVAAQNPALGKKIKRVALFSDDLENVLHPSLAATTVSLLTRMGVEVLVPPELDSCGAVEFQLGAEKRLIKAAKHNVDILSRLHDEQPVDAIISTSSRCGAVLRDYGYILRHEEGYARRAEDISLLARDVTELLDIIPMLAPSQWSNIKVAYHGSGALENWQKVSTQPRSLLQQAGYEVLEIPQGFLSCGAGGIYHMLHPLISKALRTRMLDNIDKIEPDILVVSDISCLNHLRVKAQIPVVHTVELLNWAYGGKCPPALKHLEKRVHKISGVLVDSLMEEYN